MTFASKLKKIVKNPRSVLEKINEYRISKIIKKNSSSKFFFIQIGSNDGVSSDPLNNFIKTHNWKGILIEPVPYLFEKLKETYKGKNLVFENVAVSNKEELKDFYRIKKNNEPNNPDWYEQIGSFDKNTILKHKNEIPNFEKHLTKEKIKATTIKNLIKKHKVSKIDLLHLDTEGFDFEIIKTIDFNEIKPKMILYEHLHLSNQDKTSCENLLKQNYKLLSKYGDTFAY
jgi:FkbM family methyltransferase